MASTGAERVIFELDNKQVANVINKPSTNLTELGSFPDRCRDILASFPNFQVKFIRRQANLVAHELA